MRKEDGTQYTQSIANVLPSGSILGTRIDIGGVNQAVFVRWCKTFVQSVQNLTANNRKVLMVTDACRAHLSLQCLSILKDGGVGVYAIP